MAGDETTTCYKLRTEGEQSTAGDETTETRKCARALRVTKKNMQARHNNLGRAGMINKLIWPYIIPQLPTFHLIMLDETLIMLRNGLARSL